MKRYCCQPALSSLTFKPIISHPHFKKEVCLREMLQLQSDGPVVLGKCRNELKMESIFLWKRLNEAVSLGRDCGGLSARCGQCDDDNGSRVFNVFIAVLPPEASEIIPNRQELSAHSSSHSDWDKTPTPWHFYDIRVFFFTAMTIMLYSPGL